MKPIILIPMAGNGTRFSKAGYVLPKPLIDIMGNPMIQHVINCIPFDADWIFVVQQDHINNYQIDEILQKIKPGCHIISTESGVTEGAACTVLLARDLIDNNRQLVIINSDNIIDWDGETTMINFSNSGNDGLILTFRDTDPKWSFVKLNEQGHAIEVAEKKPISDIATAGLYVWSKGCDFVAAADQMIAKNIRVNNEFYLAPVYNENIEMGHKIAVHDVVMHGVGTPEDLQIFLQGKSSIAN